MADETLLTAARRVMMNINADLKNGGIITETTEMSLITLEKQVRKADALAKQNGDYDNCAQCGAKKDEGCKRPLEFKCWRAENGGTREASLASV